MQLNNVLDLAQNYQPPYVLAANLLDPEGQFPEMFRGWTIDDPRREEDSVSLVGRVQPLCAAPLSFPAAVIGTLPITGRPRVGYFGLIGDSVIDMAKQRNPTLKFASAREIFPEAVKPFLDAKPVLRVLLFQGTSEEAKQFLEANPKIFQIVLCRSDADVAPLLPIKDESGTWIIMVGHRGKDVGVVAYRHGQPLRYRLEELIEELELPDNKTNPTREVMKEYVWGVYRNNYLKDVPKIAHPLQLQDVMQNAEFVGSAKCIACHATAHATWSNSQHSHAWETLVKYGRPIAEVRQKDMSSKLIGRQFDPDCVSCHVTGFGYKGGFIDQEKTPHLFGNGCENCHGPASLHLTQPTSGQFSKPLHMDITAKETENKCRKCHDLDNDPHFDMKKWEKIKHGREGQTPHSAP
jgi:hypothetical protein